MVPLRPASPSPLFDAFDPSEVRLTSVRGATTTRDQRERRRKKKEERRKRMVLVDASRAGRGTLEMVRAGKTSEVLNFFFGLSTWSAMHRLGVRFLFEWGGWVHEVKISGFCL